MSGLTPEAMDVQVVKEDVGELTPVPVTPGTLWRTDDPAEILKRAKETADALAPVIREAGLVSNISGKDYLQVEAWQTLGQQVGVTPVVTSTSRVSDPDGWEARCEARTLDGRTIGAADSMCLRSEERWAKSEDFELRSMAQTRAMSRALASVLRFIPTLAGMAGTPAEEMQGKRGGGERKLEGAATAPQKRAITTVLNKAGVARDFQKTIVHAVGGDPLTKAGASKILDVLNRDDFTPEQNRDKLIEIAGVEWPSDLPPPDESDFEPAERPERPEDADPFTYDKERDGG